MSNDLIPERNRRHRPRFAVRLPVTVFLGNRALSGYARNVSDRGLYLCLHTSDSRLVAAEFEFQMKLPPEITLESWCSIRGWARALRREPAPDHVTGIGAEILCYSVVRGSESAAVPAPGGPPASS